MALSVSVGCTEALNSFTDTQKSIKVDNVFDNFSRVLN